MKIRKRVRVGALHARLADSPCFGKMKIFVVRPPASRNSTTWEISRNQNAVPSAFLKPEFMRYEEFIRIRK